MTALEKSGHSARPPPLIHSMALGAGVESFCAARRPPKSPSARTCRASHSCGMHQAEVRVITTGIDWDKWRHIPNPKLWEATLLLMGIDPDRHAKVNDPEYEKRLRILCANFWTIEGKPNLIGNDATPEMPVNLSRCVEWAATRWKIPPELSAIAVTQRGQDEALKNYPTVAPIKKAAAHSGTSRKTASGYVKADSEHFPEIDRMIKAGSRSAYRAALTLAEDGKLAGGGTPVSQAKRVATLYKRRYPSR